jgi:CheY-like chemotaxis protein
VTLKSQKILVIDDEVDIAMLLSEILEWEGFSVQTATNGAEALEILTTDTFSAIFTDLQMPVMGGIEFIKKYRQIDDKTPIILLTGNIDSGNHTENNGISATVRKPVDIDDLLAILDSCILRA